LCSFPAEQLAAEPRRAADSLEAANQLPPTASPSGWFGKSGLLRLNLQTARSRFDGVSIELSTSVEEQLRKLAARQGRDVRALVEDAVRQYLEAAAITDVEPSEVAEAQAALLGELRDVPSWKAEEA